MKKILIILIILIMSSAALATVFGGSNLGFSEYPSHHCSKPTKPHKPYSFSDQWEIDHYNDQVRSYNTQQNIYISCINKYVNNAKNDIERITEKTQAAIDEANY